MTVDKIQGARGALIRYRRTNPLASHNTSQTLPLHETLNGATGHSDAFAIELLPDLWHTVDLPVSLPDTPHFWAKLLIPYCTGRPFRWVSQTRRMARVARRGNLQDFADRPDPERVAMLIDKRLQDFSRRSSPAWAKKALASLRISLARRNSLTSRSSAFTRSRAALVTPSRSPVSTSSRCTQPSNVVLEQRRSWARSTRRPPTSTDARHAARAPNARPVRKLQRKTSISCS